MHGDGRSWLVLGGPIALDYFRQLVTGIAPAQLLGLLNSWPVPLRPAASEKGCSTDDGDKPASSAASSPSPPPPSGLSFEPTSLFAIAPTLQKVCAASRAAASHLGAHALHLQARRPAGHHFAAVALPLSFPCCYHLAAGTLRRHGCHLSQRAERLRPVST